MLFRIAWRNLWRNSRRTMLTVAAIGLALTVMIFMVSFIEGMMDMMVDQVARSSMGHVQIHHPEYLEKRRSKLVMNEATRLADIVKGVPGVETMSERLLLTGAIRSSTSATVRVVSVMAVDPDQEREFSSLASKVIEGGFIVPPPEALAPDAPDRVKERRGILLGTKLAQQLKVELGSKVRIDTAGFRDATAASAFWVTGILKTDTDTFDKHTVFVALEGLQEVVGAGDVAHEFSVMAESSDQVQELKDRIVAAIEAENKDGAMGPVQVQTWWEVAPEIKQMMDTNQAWSGVLYLLMMVILSAGILTTMFMVVYERRREFGIQLALGSRPSLLFAGVMAEALWISALAAGVGLVLGGICVAWLVVYGLDLSFLGGGFEFSGMFVENVYMGSAEPKVFAEPTMVVVIGTLLFALWPALRVARMKPMDGITDKG